MRSISIIFGFALLALAGGLVVNDVDLNGPHSSSAAPDTKSTSPKPSTFTFLSESTSTESENPSSILDAPGIKLRASSRSPIPDHYSSQSEPLAHLPSHSFSKSKNASSPASRPEKVDENAPASDESIAATASFIAVDSTSSGNTLIHADRKITVNSYESTAEGNSLAVDISDHSPSPSSFRDAGFTPEEEAFRTKWGWAAFSQTQRTADAEETR